MKQVQTGLIWNDDSLLLLLKKHFFECTAARAMCGKFVNRLVLVLFRLHSEQHCGACLTAINYQFQTTYSVCWNNENRRANGDVNETINADRAIACVFLDWTSGIGGGEG